MDFYKKLAFSFLLIVSSISHAQVAVGTTNPDDGSAFEIESTSGAFVPPRMTAAQMNAIPSPLNGAMVYNTDTSSYYIYSDSSWKTISNSSIVLNRSGGTVSTANNTYYDFPLGTSHILAGTGDPSVYTVLSNGTLRIEEAGIFVMTASFSVTNLPSGNHKYIIAVELNGNLIGYLTRGFVDMSGTDYFGTSGTLMYYLGVNDQITFRYVLNNNGNTVSARFFNIGVTKMN